MARRTGDKQSRAVGKGNTGVGKTKKETTGRKYEPQQCEDKKKVRKDIIKEAYFRRTRV